MKPRDYTPDRDNAILNLFFLLSSSKVATFPIGEIFMRISHSPAPRFWVSEERALRTLRAVRAGKKLASTRHGDMYKEIISRVDSLQKRNTRMKDSEAVYRAVNSPAPSFYYTPSYVRSLVYRLLRSRLRVPAFAGANIGTLNTSDEKNCRP